MPGGFHPFHAGHYALYQSALKAFPGADVYVAATNDQSERPFPFSIKEKLAKLAGVQQGRFVQVKSPFQAKEITQHYDPNSDVLIFVRSEKDKTEQPKPGGTKKDGSPAYFQPWTGKNLQPFSKHAYIAYLPTVTFGPGIQSATEIRKAWPTLDDRRKTAMVMSLYPATQKNPKLAQNVVQLLDMGMGGQQVNEFAPGNGDGGRNHEYEVYQANLNDQFDWIGGPLYQTDNLGQAHSVAYDLWKKHPDKMFMVWQERSQGSRGGYGPKGSELAPDEDLDEGWKEKAAAAALAGTMATGAGGIVLNPNRIIDGSGRSAANPYGNVNSMGHPIKKAEPKVITINGRDYLRHELPSDMSKVQIATDDKGNKVYVWVEKAGMKPQYTYYWYAPMQQVKEFAPGGDFKPPVPPKEKGNDPWGNDDRSKILQAVKQLLAAGNKVDWKVPGQMGHVVRVTDDAVTMKRWGKPYSKIHYSLMMTDDRDDQYQIMMVKPGYYKVVSTDPNWQLEEADMFMHDPESEKIMNYAQQHYPGALNKQQAFMKFVQRALKHSQEEDEAQDEQIAQLTKAVKQLDKVTESTDYLEEK